MTQPSGSEVEALHELTDVVLAGSVAVLTGAGLSTESGIPDYRGPTGRVRPAVPVTYQEFSGSDAVRRRYWARSHLGWRRIASARPNLGHRAVADLEALGLLTGTITHNVDRLHSAAGSIEVIDLHGRLDRVTCLECREITARQDLDLRLQAANPGWSATALGYQADGDADLSSADVGRFVVVDCLTCGGRLKPDVVFFGENVPRGRVADCFERLDAAQTLLVLGSSLTVMSGFRFVRHAARSGLTVMIVNQGATRGDELATVRIDAPLGETLAAVTAAAQMHYRVSEVSPRF